jgi:2-keto-4-pentenoate hydratase/2-oxohepta-3-ene-1,7-dioic acid hydratase in catechol pathway
MRLASFRAGDRHRFGIVSGAGIIDLVGKIAARDVKDVLENPAEASALKREKADWSFEEVVWQPPIMSPAHIIGIGLNTKSHFEETAEIMRRTPGDYPVYPRLFMRSPFSHVGHEAPLVIPKVSNHLDYEGEIAVVIGKSGRYIAPEDALKHIGGYACYNDGSVRDYQTHSNQVTAGKNFEASGAFGPWLLTADELPDPSALTLQTRVNGEVRQNLILSDLIFSFADLISYISQVIPLQVGDVIITGSPAGIGALTENWLRPGDRVEIEIPQVGTLSNAVIAED